jgi:hypothetical protein
MAAAGFKMGPSCVGRMKARRFLAVVVAVSLLLLGLGLGGWWWVLQRSPLRLQHQVLTVPRAARFVPRQAALSLFLLSDGEEPLAYARAVAPTRQRRQAVAAMAALRDGAFAAAGLDYRSELAGWLGPELGLALIGSDPGQTPDGWLLALRSRDGDGARRFLQRFWQTRSLAGADLQISSYRGMGLISGRGNLRGGSAVPLATALINDDLVLIASGRGVLEQALDVSQLDELNLAASPAFRDAVERLGEGAALISARADGLAGWLGLPGDGIRSLVAALRPVGTQLELEAWLDTAAAAPPWQARLDPQLGAALLAGLQGDSDNLALLQQPNAWPPLLEPLLGRALDTAAGPLPALLVAADAGPLLWSQGEAGWLFGTGAEQPAVEALEPQLAQQGLIGAPLQLEGQGSVRVWTALSAPEHRGRRQAEATELQAALAGVRATASGQAWWAENLTVLAQLRSGHQPPRQRVAQLEALAQPTAPLQWAGGPGSARQLMQSWQPWRLLAGVSAQPLTPAVKGLAVALEPDGARLHVKGRLELA